MILEIVIWAVLVVILGAVFYFTCLDFENEKVKFTKKSLLLLIPLFLMACKLCICVIPANTVGVRYSSIKGTSEKTMGEGVHLVTPFIDQIYMIDTTVQERTDKEVSVQTKDAQVVTMNVNVKYQVNSKDAFKVYKGYKTLENLNKNIIGNYTQESLNEVCTEFNVIDVLGERRNDFTKKVKEVLADKFKREGVTLKEVTVKSIDAGAEIEKAIADEAVAKKKVETAKQNQEKKRVDAETKLIEAQGEAEANRVISESVTPQLIQMKEAEARLKHGWVEVNGAAAVVK